MSRKRRAIVLTPLIIFSIAALSWIFIAKPKLVDWVKAKAPEYVEKNSDYKLTVGGIDLSLSQLNVTFSDLQLNSKTNDQIVSQAHIQSVRVQLNFFALLVGRVSLAYVAFEKGQFDIQLQEQQKKDSNPTNLAQITKLIFDNIPRIPLEKIILSDLNLNFVASDALKERISQYFKSPENMQFVINKLTIKNHGDQLEFIQTDVRILLSQDPANHFQFAAENLHYDIEKIVGTKVKINYKATHLNLDFEAGSLERLLYDPKIKFSVDAYVNLSEIHSLTTQLQSGWLKRAQVLGSVSIKGKSDFENLKKNQGALQINVEKVSLDEFSFGDATFSAQLKDNSVTLNNIEIRHPSGDAEITKIVFEQQKPYKFKATAKAKSFDLQKLFLSIGLKEIPVDLKAEGGGVCTGELTPLNINCQAQIEARDLDVRTDMPKESFSIVKLSAGSVSGDVTFTENGISYKAMARVQGSPFKSDGEVSFTNGFKINFESDGLDLSKVEDLASLNLRGIVKGKLTTSGNSSYGVITSDLVADQFEISDFKLGQFKTKFSYEKSLLKFENSEILNKNTKAAGQVVIDLNTSEIRGEAVSQSAELSTIMGSLPERLQVPFVISGLGAFKVNFNGPLDFWRLQYQLIGEFKSVMIFGEAFQQGIVKLNATGNAIIFDNVTLKKTSGHLSATGQIVTSGKVPEFQLGISSENLRFEDIDYFKNLFQNTSSDLLISGKVTQSLSDPELNVSFGLKDTLFENVRSSDSQGSIKMNSQLTTIRALLLGRQLQTQIEIPKNKTMILQAQIRDFNPLHLLPLITLPLPPSDTYSRLSGLIDLRVPLHESGRMTGTIQISDFILQRSTQYIKLVNESKLNFNGNSFAMQPVIMSGPDQKLTIKLETKNGQSYLSTQARLSLRPFQFLVPFADNLAGFTEFQFKSLLNSNKVQLMGEGLIDQASLGLKGFTYPLKKTSAFFDFSQSKIIFSEINSEINQSPITASGFIDFKGKNSVVVNLNANAPKLSLEFPPRYQTQGQAKIDVTGMWPPYTLRVKYLINDGLITDEFSEQNTRVVALTPNKYLPVQNLQSKKPSLLIDIEALFQKGLVIKNRSLEGIVTGEMNVTGSADKPELKGLVKIEPGSKLFFKDKPFDVKHGKVLFTGGPDIKPEVLISADARVSEYDINLLVKGAGQQLNIEPSSQPSLSRNDIFSLLALGYTATKLDQTVSSDLQQQQTGLEILANISNQSQLNKTIQEKLGLTVQLAPSIDSTRNIAVPKVVVSKQLGKKVNTSYSRPLTGDRQNNEIRLQWLFQPNWSLIMNYQNQSNEQNNSVITPNQTDNGVGGLDLEYKKEFK